MTLTLKETEAGNYDALWRGLPREVAARIGALALESEFLQLIAEDGGFHASHADTCRAEHVQEKVAARLKRAIWGALPTLLREEPDAAYPLGMVFEGKSRPPPWTYAALAGAISVRSASGGLCRTATASSSSAVRST